MPVFLLSDELIFPPSDYAEPDGLLAVGGDLSPQRLLLAYRLGIFPWYSENTPVLWWSPNPRLVLFPNEVKISKSLERVLRKGLFKVTFDHAFRQVVERCATAPRKQGDGTWIVPEMIEAYHRLHRLGYAHSVESWCDDELVGGLYGIGMGKVFFGESMFMQRTDASKVAFVHLIRQLQLWDCELIDCQVTTSHLIHFGAREIPREAFLAHLSRAIKSSKDKGPWSSGAVKR